MTDLLFVTSFPELLWGATGRYLVKTFDKFQTDGKLLCCQEGFAPKLPNDVWRYSVGDDPWLQAWDREHRAACKRERTYWRKRAWNWFRKAVSLRYAMRMIEPKRFMVWVDCDVEWKKNITADWLDDLCGHGQYGIVHLKGKKRTHTETGIVVYNMQYSSTPRFLQAVFDCYESGEFRDLERWDDCWIFDTIRETFMRPMFRDVAPDTKTRVVEDSPLGEYLWHKKGFHTRNRIVAI